MGGGVGISRGLIVGCIFFLQVDGPMTGWGGGGVIITGGDLIDSLTYPASTGSVSSFKQGRFSHLAIIRNFFFFQG